MSNVVYGELHARFLAKLKEAEEIKDHLAKLEAFMASAKALLSIGGEFTDWSR